jgi:hypothetical protein
MKIKEMLHKLWSVTSVIAGIAFLTLFILYISDKNDILLRMLDGYLHWIDKGPILPVLIVFIITSVGSSKIITVGICGTIIKDEKRLSNKIYWIIFAVFFAMQLLPRIFFQR